MRERRRHAEHGRRRLWYAPWQLVCRCGRKEWPCYVVVMLDRQQRMQPQPRENAWAGRATVPAFRLPRTAAPTDRPLLTRGQAYRTRGRT